MRCHITDGILDGTVLDAPERIEKLVIQTTEGVTHRYEWDQDLEDHKGEYQRLVLTADDESFDVELREDELTK